MNVNLTTNNRGVDLNINDEFICLINSVELLSDNSIKSENFSGQISLQKNELILKISSESFEIVTFNFENIIKDGNNKFEVNTKNHVFSITADNATIVSNKKLIVGFNKNTNINFKLNNSTSLNSSNVFKAQAITSVLLLSEPPSFSITFSTTYSSSTKLFKSYKDRQILNGNISSNCNVQIFSNIPYNLALNISTATLNQYYFSGLSTTFNLSALTSNTNGTAVWQYNLPLTSNNTSLDGASNFYVTIHPFQMSGNFETISGVKGGSTFNQITNMQIGLNSSIYSSPFSSNPLSISGVTTVGFASFALVPSWIFTNSFTGFNTVPYLNSNTYLSLFYQTASSSLNNFIGGICSSVFTPSNGPYVTVVFIASEDLYLTDVNTSSYNIQFQINYTDGTYKIISPNKKNIILYNDGTQNYIAATSQWSQFLSGKTFLNLQAQITKFTNNYPNEFRIYQFTVYNITSSSEPSFVVQSLPESKTNYQISQMTGVKKGDTILGYENEQNTFVQVLSVEQGIIEPIYRLHFQAHSIELPESFSLMVNSEYKKVFNLNINDTIKTQNGLDKIKKIELLNSKPYFVIKTTSGNHYANDVLVKPE